MTDQRNKLQGLFQPKNRYENFGEAIVRMHVQGFRCHRNTVIEVESPITAFCGLNGTGKSTLLQLAAVAYKNAPGYQRRYVKNFIIAGKLDQTPFTPNASVKFEYLQPIAAGGAIQTKSVTVSRGNSKWTGYKRQPERRVYFAGVGLYLPRIEEWDSATRHASTLTVQNTVSLSAEVKDKIAQILGTVYDAANENHCKIKAKSQKVITVGRNAVTYSEANMGCGEGRIYHIVRVLEELPDRSLVLLEEPETSLHPSAQHNFGKYLVDVSVRKRHQIFLTTHSEYLLMALPQRSRILFLQTPSGLHQIPGIGVRQAMSLMSDQHVPALHILVEDDVAQAVVTELLRRHDPFFLRTVRIGIGGDKKQIGKFMEVFCELGMQVCAVRDGDTGENPTKRLFKLFGVLPPEKEIFQSPTFRQLMEDKYHINWNDLRVALDAKDHHEWFDELERIILMKRDALLQIAAKSYLNLVSEGEQIELIEKLKGAAAQ